MENIQKNTCTKHARPPKGPFLLSHLVRCLRIPAKFYLLVGCLTVLLTVSLEGCDTLFDE